MFKKFYLFWIFFFVSTLVKAEESEKKPASLGQFADEATVHVGFLSDFIETGSLILGVICFFWGFMRFLEYKKNPYTTTLGSVIVVVIPAVALVSLPFLSFIIGVEVNPLKK